jgi:hypothetical protein
MTMATKKKTKTPALTNEEHLAYLVEGMAFVAHALAFSWDSERLRTAEKLTHPKPGDWVVEMTSVLGGVSLGMRLGILIWHGEITDDPDPLKRESWFIQLLNGKVQRWTGARFIRLCNRDGALRTEEDATQAQIRRKVAQDLMIEHKLEWLQKYNILE